MTTAGNYVLLERVTVGAAGASSVTFNNIPQTGYTDLKIVLSARSTANGGQNVNLNFNGITSGYSDKILGGTGSAASSFPSGNTTKGGSCVIPGADFTLNTFGNGEIYIPNAFGNTAKSYSSDSVSENNATLSYAQMQATLWSYTGNPAITSILITLSSGNFAQYSTFSLYALAAVGTTPTKAPKASGGDIVQYDGTYWYHAFINSGSFIPQIPLSCDVLVVAGGGSGGAGTGGGGGAGGLRLLASQGFAPNTAYTCTTGAGAASVTGSAHGNNGTNSSLIGGSISISATGGGGGAAENTNNAQTGGSGGGGSYNGYNGAAGNAGSYSPVEGYAGGVASATYNGSGGGGAGGTGFASTTSGSTGVGGVGGVGAGGTSYTNYAILDAMGAATTTGVLSSSHYYYAGGGGGGGQYSTSPYTGQGGAGGTGGGGTGGAYNPATAGTSALANTGGGGGGGGTNSNTSGAGGSGVVIVRYLA